MKKYLGILALILTLGLSTMAPRKAEAGVLIVAGSGGAVGWIIAGAATATVGAYTAIFTAIDPEEAWFLPQFAIPGGAAAFVLGKQDNAHEEKAIAVSRMQIRYPGVGKNLISEVVDRVYNKLGVGSLSELTKNKMVVFSKEEIETILQTAPESSDKDRLIEDLTN